MATGVTGFTGVVGAWMHLQLPCSTTGAQYPVPCVPCLFVEVNSGGAGVGQVGMRGAGGETGLKETTGHEPKRQAKAGAGQNVQSAR